MNIQHKITSFIYFLIFTYFQNIIPLTIYLFIYIDYIAYRKMQKENQMPFIDHSSWLDCIGDLHDDIHLPLNTIPQEEEMKIDTQHIIQHPISEHNENSNNQLMELIQMHQCVDKEMFKRSHPEVIIDDEFFTSNSSSNDLKIGQNQEIKKSGYRKEKYAKQYIYSKNYRDKKKQQFKALQEENTFLKLKIDELQLRLRQKQMQINRLKHHSNEKQLTIQELNRQFLTKVTLFAEKIQDSITKIQEPKQSFKKTRAMYCDQLIRTYDEHGFSGSRKREILNYHLNEIMQVVLRDSEKYLCMLCCKNKNDKLQKQMPEYHTINHAFIQIAELKEQDYGRLHQYIKFLFPLMKQIKKNCSDIYKSFSKIMETNGKIHQFMRSSYLQNLDFVKKRMKLESWFQYHKYHKIMRKLKAEWLQFVKNQKPLQTETKTKHKNGHKKKKTQQTQNQ